MKKEKIQGFKIKIFLGFVLFLSFFSFLYFYLRPQEKIPSTFKALSEMEKKGLPFDEFSLFEGGKIHLKKDLKGKVFLLNVWASWCTPCYDEFPSFLTLLQRHGGKIHLIALSKDSDENFERFKKNFDSSPHLSWVQDPEGKISDAIGVGAVPETFIFDSKHKLVEKSAGFEDWDSAMRREFFKELLKSGRRSQ